MELNVNFKRELKPLINSSEALADWFEKNQEMMAYFEMTHPGCLHFENTNANYDVKVLANYVLGFQKEIFPLHTPIGSANREMCFVYWK